MNLDIELVTVVVGVAQGVPVVLTVPEAGPQPALPAGPLEHSERSLQAATRGWVEELTGHRLGYLEQLYTFADADRGAAAERVISISYLGLTRVTSVDENWIGWYDLLPWEDRRESSDIVVTQLAPLLHGWAAGAASAQARATRERRVALTFGLDRSDWVPDLALQRYELLYEAGLLPESPASTRQSELAPGLAMAGDHRRILATAMARLRAKIQYRPVVFELLPPQFTLGELQRCVEALAGHTVHTQNFHRLVDQQRLVEPCGGTAKTGGRPAKLYRFHADVLDARAVVGTKLPTTRGAR